LVGSPIGEGIYLNFLGKADSAPWWPEYAGNAFTIVGVVGDIAESRLGDPVRPVMYLSYRQNPSRYAHLLIRTEGSGLNVLEMVRQQLRSIDPDIGVYDVQAMQNVLDQAVAAPRLNSGLLWIFAATALLLCAVGVYGVTSYVVELRTREFAIRLAIGAPPSRILQIVTSDGVRVALIGIMLGVIGALSATRLLQSLVFGVAVAEPLTLLGSSALVFVGQWPPVGARHHARQKPIR
jgi:ABC-type antimicrobial peptide transport system permease subunit